eukprot:TRINITY_DN24213_c0_g1_i3.p1 TRINITY_DN24213_c0_g1~~TRINITY_DN24213_c0_g1_i3.p1  ORF type:complete len:874 (-),score=200.73 TRINITY_DN24213_c0_g1_i3:269-2890(-)
MPGDTIRPLILYASQTGTAESIAQRLHADGIARGHVCRMHPLNHFKELKNLHQETCILFVVATTGDGECPENGNRFVSFIKRKTHAEGTYRDCRYAVLGLGDSNYNQFCAPSITVDRRMGDLGARQIASLAMGDDATELSEVVEPWLESIWDKVGMACVPDQTGPSTAAPGGDGTVGEESPLAGVLESTSGSLPPTSVTVFWGGEEGGMAELCAEYVRVQAEAHNCTCGKIWPANQWKKADWEGIEKLVLVCSSDEAGAPPTNCNRFFNLLKRKLTDPKLAAAIQFASVVLGPSGVGHELRAGSLINSNLERLSGTQLVLPLHLDLPAAESDTQPIGALMDPWLSALWPPLCSPAGSWLPKTYVPLRKIPSFEMDKPTPAQPTTTPKPVKRRSTLQESLPQLSLSLCSDQGAQCQGAWWRHRSDPAFAASGQLTAAERLTSREYTERVVWCAEIEMDLEYQPGDAIGVWPHAPASAARELASALRLDPDTLVESISGNGDAIDSVSLDWVTFPQSIQSLFSHVYDVSTVVSKPALMAIAETCTDPEEAVRMSHLGSDPETYRSQVLAAHLALPQLLATFPSASPPLSLVLSALNLHKPRYYSIACSPHTQKQSAKIAFSLVPNGLCTSWLNRLCESLELGTIQSSDKFAIFLKRATTFVLPADSRRPVIMVGPGTGVAPFIGFLQHLKFQQALNSELCKNSSSGCITSGTWGSLDLGDFGLEEEEEEFPVGFEREVEAKEEQEGSVPNCTETWLFTGFRHERHDFLFREELSALSKQSSGSLQKLKIAFSRDTENKVYVQHKMREVGGEICDILLERGGYMFVCGDGNRMAKDVREAVQQIFVEHGELNEKEARRALNELVKEHRFVLDIWSS